jgi:hypothetical protein
MSARNPRAPGAPPEDPPDELESLRNELRAAVNSPVVEKEYEKRLRELLRRQLT